MILRPGQRWVGRNSLVEVDVHSVTEHFVQMSFPPAGAVFTRPLDGFYQRYLPAEETLHAASWADMQLGQVAGADLDWYAAAFDVIRWSILGMDPGATSAEQDVDLRRRVETIVSGRRPCHLCGVLTPCGVTMRAADGSVAADWPACRSCARRVKEKVREQVADPPSELGDVTVVNDRLLAKSIAAVESMRKVPAR